MSRDPREACRIIGATLSECMLKKRKPTADEMMAMLSWALAGRGIYPDGRGGESLENGDGGKNVQ